MKQNKYPKKNEHGKLRLGNCTVVSNFCFIVVFLLCEFYIFFPLIVFKNPKFLSKKLFWMRKISNFHFLEKSEWQNGKIVETQNRWITVMDIVAQLRKREFNLNWTYELKFLENNQKQQLYNLFLHLCIFFISNWLIEHFIKIQN